MEQYDFFTVRVWRRDGEHGEQWTGRLEHLQRQESWRFSDADALLAYLSGLIGLHNGPAPLAAGSLALEQDVPANTMTSPDGAGTGLTQ